jgi:hypothetical protein
MPVPLWVAGSITIAALVGLGVFVYPPCLRRPLGRVAVALATVALAVLFHWFDGGRTDPALRVALALLWALAPLAVGLIVARIGTSGRLTRRPVCGMGAF